MADGSDKGSFQSIAQFGDGTAQLKEVNVKYPVPNIVKIIKGQYRNIGVSKSSHNEIYLHSVRTIRKVCAEGIKIKDKKKIISIGQKFSLPVTYEGWFEVLSEDGKAVKPVEKVSDLAKAAPQQCIVRDNCKAYTARENGDLNFEKPRIIQAGEILTLAGEFSLPRGFSKKRFLRCTDMHSRVVYLNYDLKGEFSPLAGHGNISGVHTVKGLVEKFRLPILVRLVHGIVPGRLQKNLFTGAFRFLNVYSDETAFVCPLRKDSKMVPISTREPLKVIISSNFEEIRGMDGCKLMHMRTTRMIQSYLNSIHVLVNLPDVGILQRNDDLPSPVRSKQVTSLPKSEEDTLFAEIDDIYAYVREGGDPPPPRPRPHETHKSDKSGSKKKLFGSSHKGQREQKTGEYWEEPIYEQIDRLKKRQSTGPHQAEHDHSSSPLPPYKGSMEKITPIKPASPFVSAASYTDDHQLDDRHPPPPVPPKLYAAEEEQVHMNMSDEELHGHTSSVRSSGNSTSVFVPREKQGRTLSGALIDSKMPHLGYVNTEHHHTKAQHPSSQKQRVVGSTSKLVFSTPQNSPFVANSGGGSSSNLFALPSEYHHSHGNLMDSMASLRMPHEDTQGLGVNNQLAAHYKVPPRYIGHPMGPMPAEQYGRKHTPLYS